MTRVVYNNSLDNTTLEIVPTARNTQKFIIQFALNRFRIALVVI